MKTIVREENGLLFVLSFIVKGLTGKLRTKRAIQGVPVAPGIFMKNTSSGINLTDGKGRTLFVGKSSDDVAREICRLAKENNWSME